MRVSLRKIATETGLNVSTVSRALRDLSCVDPHTREIVQKTAERLGYIRDPLMSNALAFARRTDKPIYRNTIAFLAPVPQREFHAHYWIDKIHQAIRNRIAGLGYGMECHVIPQTARAQRQLGRQLLARGIRGCVVSPVDPNNDVGSTELDLDWQQIVGIEIGHSLKNAALPRIYRNYPDDVLMVLNNLSHRGYRTIGVAVSKGDEERRRWALYSQCLLFAKLHPKVRIYFLFEDETEYTLKSFSRWFAKRSPEAIIVNGPGIYSWLNVLGIKLGQDVGLCRIDCPNDSEESGLCLNYRTMGDIATTLLATALEKGSFEGTQSALTFCISSTWNEGNTLRSLSV